MQIPTPSQPDLPAYFKLSQAMFAMLSGWRGGTLLYRLLGRLGFLKRAGRFNYFGGSIYVPLEVPETLFVHDFSLFQGLREFNFAHAINDHLGPDVIFIDAGAYFGQVSMRISRLCPRVTRILAIEANADSCDVLRANLALSRKNAVVANVAVSNKPGRGRLLFPRGEADRDSAYLVHDPRGSIEIKTVDQIIAEASFQDHVDEVALKIDIEGEEEALIEGATNLLQKANAMVLFVELHPEVLKRKQRTAEDLLKRIEAFRPVRWFLADHPEMELFSSADVFQQIGEERPVDVIGIAAPPEGRRQTSTAH